MPGSNQKFFGREEAVYIQSLQWTQTHSHFFCMGGLAIISNDPTRPSRRQVTVDWNGFLFFLLLKPEIIPQVSGAELQDKSKEDAFSKGLVLVQGMLILRLCSFCLN